MSSRLFFFFQILFVIAFSTLLSAQSAQNAFQLALVLAHQHHRLGIIKAHQAQNALCICDAAARIMHANVIVTACRSVHNAFHFVKVGNFNLLYHNDFFLSVRVGYLIRLTVRRNDFGFPLLSMVL